jgi:hypothetical protein
MAAFARALPITDTRLDRLTRCRDVGVAAFGKVAARLEATNTSATALIGQLKDLERCSLEADDARDPLAEVSMTLRQLTAILANLGAASQDNSLADAQRQGQSALDGLHRESIKLMAISAITLINSRSIGGVDLGDYVKSLRMMATALQEGAAAVSSGLVRIGQAQDQVAATASTACQTLAQADSAIDISQNGQAMQSRQVAEARSAMIQLTVRLAKAVTDDVQVLMVGIQFSDAYAQRIEHICAMMDRLDRTGSPDERTAIETLMAAQIWHLAQESDEAVARSCQALERIATMATQVRAAFGSSRDGTDGAAQSHLQHRRAALDQVVQSSHLIEPAIAAANAAANSVGRDAQAAVSRFADLTRTTEAMTLSAFNAGLITSRGGTARAALSVLALAVHESVDACGRQIKRCQSALKMISTVRADAGTSEIGAAAAEFAARIDACVNSLSETETTLARIARLRDSSSATGETLLAATAATTSEVVYVLDASKDLRDLAHELCDNPAQARINGVLPDQLADIQATYTMDRERVIHDQLFGIAARAPVTPVAESVDDFLF